MYAYRYIGRGVTYLVEDVLHYHHILNRLPTGLSVIVPDCVHAQDLAQHCGQLVIVSFCHVLYDVSK